MYLLCCMTKCCFKVKQDCISSTFREQLSRCMPTNVPHALWCIIYDNNISALAQVGRYPRHIISLFFRLLYPWCWPSSCWNFIVSCIRAVLFSLLRLLFSGWDKLREPKRY
uniref:Uncharacterized protein LOC105628231 isoform X2 n=1 Tax=Rhizophora mucronata TaxID=61149 RepID=A0A2P2LAI1_RHIMU